jgi:Oleosin
MNPASPSPAISHSISIVPVPRKQHQHRNNQTTSGFLLSNMAEHQKGEGQRGGMMGTGMGGGTIGSGSQMQQKQPMLTSVLKALTAATAGGSMLVLSGLTLAGTVIALTVATPLLVIFSPVLMPAAIAVALLAAGFVTSGGLGVAALSVFSWMYKYLTGKKPPGADQLEQAKARFASKAKDTESAQHRIDQVQAS